jgi:glycosyltransferase involved in cell wall biosynthesis
VPRSERLRDVLGLGSEARLALYQGFIQEDRGLDTLVLAAPFLEADTIIVLMGKATPETLSHLRALVSSTGVEGRVKILPPVPYVELLEWTASADVGLIVYQPDYAANVRGMLPNKLFEYLMAGLPVLASRLPAVEEVINTFCVGQVVPSLAPADIGSAIDAMLRDRDALESMRSNALEAARSEFNWEQESRRVVDLYRDLLRSLENDRDGTRDSTLGEPPLGRDSTA